MSARILAPSVAIDALIADRRLVTHFQPILSARQQSIVGVEALSRGVPSAGEGEIVAPKTLFALAASQGLTARLETLCCETAVQQFAGLPGRPDGLMLFVNLSLSIVRDQSITADALRALVCAAGLSPAHVAVEILEAEIDDMQQLCELVASFRAAGFLLALDDVGVGHSNLNRIPLIRPDILKVDRSLISGIDGDYYRQETLKSLVGLSRKIGALVVAEGIETEDEAMVALELGADLLQGYFLGRPAANGIDEGAGTSPEHRITTLAQRFKRHMVAQISERKREHRRNNLVLNQILWHLSGASVERFDGILADFVGHHPNVECVYVLDEDGLQVTETVGPAIATRRAAGILFHPALKGTDHSLKEYYYVLLGVELPQYTTEPYVSLASGSISRTVSTGFRDAENRLFVLCIDVVRE